MSIKQVYCNESQKSLSWRLLFKVPLFIFFLFLHFSIWACYYNEYPVKQTSSLYFIIYFIVYLVVAFETWIFGCAFVLFGKVKFYFWKGKCFTYFKFIFFCISIPISSMEGDKLGILSTASDWKKTLFA